MGQEAFASKRAGGGGSGGLPVVAGGRANPRPSRGRQIQKTFNNLKITLLCGFVTILVLRGTIGVGPLSTTPSSSSSSDPAADAQRLLQETNRILAEIRAADADDADDDVGSIAVTSNSTSPKVEFRLGPKITDWDDQRRRWLAANPSFPATISGGKKPRILLLTGSAPTPCDNPIGDHYLLKAAKNKMDYCRIHGMEIVYNIAFLDKELAGYWAKLPMIRRLMLSHPEVEWIWWMDSDALFTDMVFEIPHDKYKSSNLIIHGYPDLLYEKHSWIALNTGSFLLRNCQWTLDMLDEWAPMGPKGAVRDEAGRVLTAFLKGRPPFEADDQSALIYLLITQKDKWMEKVFVENSYYLHGYWVGLVEKYEEMLEKHRPGYGDDRWPFVTHFVGCKPCGSYGDYPVKRCLKSMERAFNFADDQVLQIYGFGHRGLLTPKIKRIRNQTATPLETEDPLNLRHPAFGDRARNR